MYRERGADTWLPFKSGGILQYAFLSINNGGRITVPLEEGEYLVYWGYTTPSGSYTTSFGTISLNSISGGTSSTVQDELGRNCTKVVMTTSGNIQFTSAWHPQQGGATSVIILKV